jgi:aldose 1-epimerase
MKKRKLTLKLFLMLLLTGVSTASMVSCNNKESKKENTETASTSAAQDSLTMKKESFGKTNDGQEVYLYTLTNQNGVTAKITNYGGIVTSLVTPDKNGQMGDVVLGFDAVSGYQSEAYMKSMPYFGAIIGRYGNRIAKGRFSLDGKEYTLATNNGENHLHGGIKGFDKVVWTAEELPQQNALKLTYVSKDGEEGYPGNLTTTVIYTLTENNELKIDYEASTDKATPVNLTNHSYFNLAAGKAEDALDHILMLNADKFTVVDAALIPTGENRNVKGTPMDFTTPVAIGARIAQVEGGYDHNYVLTDTSSTLKLAATVYEPLTGRFMEVHTTEPGVQFYSGNFLDASLTGKGNIAYRKHYGFCLETQHFPDSPNQPNFPSTILRPGEKYAQTTVYKFSAKENL